MDDRSRVAVGFAAVALGNVLIGTGNWLSNEGAWVVGSSALTALVMAAIAVAWWTDADAFDLPDRGRFRRVVLTGWLVAGAVTLAGGVLVLVASL